MKKCLTPSAPIMAYEVPQVDVSVPVPMVNKKFDPDEPDEEATRNFLESKGWNKGLQNQLLKSVEKFQYRFYICDNSGSMSECDGKRIIGTSIVGCSRWLEVVETITFHAHLANALKLPSEFRMLNDYESILIDGDNDDGLSTILKQLVNSSPSGSTPLCRHIREIIEEIKDKESFLRSQNQRAVIIIMTDGEASDGDLREVMTPLQYLPVYVIIRLCTDNSNIINYWNNIDNNLEIEIDILDDMVGESREIYAKNPWLNYTEPMHRMREFGIIDKVFDLIDEIPLKFDQIHTLCKIYYNKDLPHPEYDLNQFIDAVKKCADNESHLYSITRNKPRPLIEYNLLQSSQSSQSYFSCRIL